MNHPDGNLFPVNPVCTILGEATSIASVSSEVGFLMLYGWLRMGLRGVPRHLLLKRRPKDNARSTRPNTQNNFMQKFLKEEFIALYCRMLVKRNDATAATS
jgi:hypothetical protein